MFFIGDLHGVPQAVETLNAQAAPGVPFVQVGDLGWYPRMRPMWNRVGESLQRTLYWIDGNHEYFPEVPLDADEPVEVAPNIYYVPRGTVLELEGKRIGCLGGATSVDYKQRVLGRDWFHEENLRNKDILRATSAAWDHLDAIVTHVPPQCTLQDHFNPNNLTWFGLDPSWRDPNADQVEFVWRNAGCPPLICGHMHRSVFDGNVRILDINEFAEF